MKDNFLNHESEEECLSLQNIEFGLRHIPALIASQAEKCENARDALDIAKIRLKVKEAEVMLRECNGKLNATDKKAMGIVGSQDEQINVVKAQSMYNREVIKLTELENKFVSIRKQANISITEREAQQREQFGTKVPRRMPDDEY